MKRWRLGMTVAMCVAAVTAAVLAANASAAGVSVTKTAPTSVTCDGDVAVEVKVAEGTTGLDVVIVLDLSGSIATPASDFAALKQAALDALAALDASDGLANQQIAGKQVGIVSYRQAEPREVEAALGGSSYATLVGAVNTGLDSPTGGSPHDQGIDHAADLGAERIILISDGVTTSQTVINAADAAKGSAVLVPLGIGADQSQANLQNWASDASSYQNASTATVNKDKLIRDLGGTTFSLTDTVLPPFGSSDTLTLSGTLLGGEATLEYTATRNGSETEFGQVETETVSTTALTVNGESAPAPAPLEIDVLPCGADDLLDSKKDCTGPDCGAGGENGGVAYSVNPGNVGTSTDLFVSSLESAPPLLPNGKSVCPGFEGNTNGVQFDIRPLTTDGKFEITIPKAALGSKKWWQTGVCVGTNLRFITAIGSLANLRPGATATAGRWWGLLPSVKRYTLVGGKLVAGPWISKRSVDSAGNAKIEFTMPFVANSASQTTNGQNAYDPKAFGG
jgi:hypothetical protein